MIRIDTPMPSSCRECQFHERDLGYCILFSNGIPNRYQIDKFTERPLWCELEGDKQMSKEEMLENLERAMSAMSSWCWDTPTYEEWVNARNLIEAVYTELASMIGGIEKAIDDAPTVDAEPVVRCFDCKYAGTDNCAIDPVLATEDDGCTWGERKEDAEH